MNDGPRPLLIVVRYWSWFRDLAGTDQESFEMPHGSLLADLLARVREAHPRFEQVRRSTLVAVGVDYQTENHPLRDADEVSLFPPVQGG